MLRQPRIWWGPNKTPHREAGRFVSGQAGNQSRGNLVRWDGVEPPYPRTLLYRQLHPAGRCLQRMTQWKVARLTPTC